MRFWSPFADIRSQLALLLRNSEEIKAQLAVLIAAQPRISPADQAKLNSIYDTATKDVAKIDATKK